MIRKIAILALFLGSYGLAAQNGAALEWTQVRTNILQNHPFANQAFLLEKSAAAALLSAKGGFDPKTFTTYSAKDFKGKHYYSFTEAGVKVPTWAGIEMKGAYNIARGNFLNSEREIPANGQASLGIHWTLGQGLVLDDRRANLRRANIGIDQNDAEQENMLNVLVYEGVKSYWNWVLFENQLVVTTEAQRQATLRLIAVRESYLEGDKPAMDTLEAYIQLQNRQLDRNFALTDAQNAKIALQFYYWSDAQAPIDTALFGNAPLLVLTLYTNIPNIDSLVTEAMLQHPDLRIYNADLRLLDIEKRLKFEKTKPVFDLNYNILGAGWSFFPTGGVAGAGVLANDLKWGIDFSYPIPNRKARGDLQMTKIKIDQTNLKVLEKRQSIENKIRQYGNELGMLSRQIAVYRSLVDNYKLLLDAENTKFVLGESSIFLINTREQKWLESQVKYLKLLSEFRKTEAALRWASGIR